MLLGLLLLLLTLIAVMCCPHHGFREATLLGRCQYEMQHCRPLTVLLGEGCIPVVLLHLFPAMHLQREPAMMEEGELGLHGILRNQHRF